jgi:NAD-dependent deacetylase
MSEQTEQIARWLRDSANAVAFTGAGISTESGIPDFRSPGGVWATSQPVYFADFLQSADARLEYWRQKAALHDDMVRAQPNVAHRALAQWESSGNLRGVVTQNIDGLHQQAGSRQILELHGTAREICCLDCGERFDADEMVRGFQQSQEAPNCPHCDGFLKHATISFGQSLPEEVLSEAVLWARETDFFLVFGSSLVVEPAASLPRIAKQAGARLAIINRDATPLDTLADVTVNSGIGAAITSIERSLDPR